MSKILRGKGIRRTHMQTPLMRESLVDKGVLARSEPDREVRMLPEANIVGVGGGSIMDRGKAAVYPLCDELVECNKHHKMVVGVSGGGRADHTMEVGIDLGLPTGGLAQIVGAVEEQNGAMLQALLSAHGGVWMPRDAFSEIALYLELGSLPIVASMPPYHFWEEPPREGRLPMNGPDVGLYLMAEVLGVKRLIFVKDVDGIYENDPNVDPDARFIPEATSQDLLEGGYPSLLIEPKVLELMPHARNIRDFQIINGLTPGNLTRALDGEHVGTIVRA